MQLPAVFRIRPLQRESLAQSASVLLVVASLLVGVAIAAPEPISRAVNGVSGLLWIAAAGLLIVALRDDPRFWSRLAVVVVVGMVLVLVVRPSDLLMALAGFGAAGAGIAWFTADRGLSWAILLPALWLPEHLLTAVGRSIYRAVRELPATIRTDPPPTAALVPFAMVAAAWLGAWLVVRFRNQRMR